jgi:hypothetical protein
VNGKQVALVTLASDKPLGLLTQARSGRKGMQYGAGSTIIPIIYGTCFHRSNIKEHFQGGEEIFMQYL